MLGMGKVIPLLQGFKTKRKKTRTSFEHKTEQIIRNKQVASFLSLNL